MKDITEETYSIGTEFSNSESVSSSDDFIWFNLTVDVL